MRRDYRSCVPVVLATACVAFAAFAGAADETGEIVRRSFEVTERASLIVDSDLGAIEVTAAEAPTIKVTVAYDGRHVSRGALARFLDRFRITFEARRDSVTVTGRLTRGERGLFGWGENPGVTFHITVPEQADLDLSTGGGSIRVGALEGSVKARTSGGSLSFGRIGGPIWGRTSGGGITLDGCGGEVDVETSGGSIRIGDVSGKVRAETSGGSVTIGHTGGPVSAHTSGGSIHVVEATGALDATTSGGSIEASIGRQPQGDCRLDTSGGSVTVRLAESIHVDLEASANRVVCDVPVTIKGTIEEGRLTGTINGGGPRLEVHTAGGAVLIEKL
jgi:Toastrack DUF4097